MKAILRHKDELRRLHERELPLCPWDWDRMEMIFPGKPRKRICAGHNPANLLDSDVGVADGWRLLATAEIGARDPLPGIELWVDGKWYNAITFAGSDLGATYRTKIPYPIKGRL